MKKRLLSILLVLRMVCTLLPVSVFAASEVTYAMVESRVMEYYNAVTNNGTVNAYWNANIHSGATSTLKSYVDSGNYAKTVTRSSCGFEGNKSNHLRSKGCTSNLFAGVGSVNNSNVYSPTSADAQCSGFAAFMEYVIFRTTSDSSFKVLSSAPGTVKPGDQVRSNGHSYVIYKVSGDTAYIIECNNPSGSCKINLGTKSVSSIKKLSFNGSTSFYISSPAVNHTHSYTAVVTAATCTAQGYTTYTCTCGDSYKGNYTSALGHNYVNGECTRCYEKDPDYVISGKCGDNLTWKLNAGTLTISGTGDMYSYSGGEAPWYDSISSIKKVIIESGVTSIGSCAFYKCSSLTNVTIPSNVKSIGSHAFEYCSSLTSVTIPESVTSIGGNAFCHCSSLASVTIGNSVTSIGGSAFYDTAYYKDGNNWNNGLLYIGKYLIEADSNVTTAVIKDGTLIIADYAFGYHYNLTSVTIPNSVTNIGEKTFFECKSLKSVTIGNNVTSIGERAFWRCSSLTNVTIPSSVTSIGREAFEECSSLKSVTIPNSVTSIGNNAFDYCSSLTSITIPNSVTEIGDNAFAYCSSLTSITIPSSVKSIGYYAFEGCSRITSVTIGNGVTSIGYGAFRYCSSLTSVTIPESVTSIGGNAFYDTAYYKDGNNWNNGLLYIGKYLINAKTDITTANIKDGTVFIGDSAFSGCTGLTSVTIPDSVTSIGNYAFSGCSSLTSVTIPDSVTSIGYYAFKGCTGLTSAKFLGDAPSEFGNSVFSNCAPDFKILVPKGNTTWTASDAYNAAAQTWHRYPIEFYDDHQHDYTAVVTKPTCTEQGYTTHTCSCGDSYVDDYVAAIGHDYVDGVCTRCGDVVIAITAQPESVSAVSGKNVTFSVAATGSGLTYQWQYKTPTGTKWNTSTSTGAKTASLTVQATDARDGQQYRCVVTDADGNSVTSKSAKLTVTSALAIKTQPESVSAVSGKNVTFSVAATGSGLSYQWQHKTPTGTKWNTSTSTGAKTAKLSISATAARNGQQYRCVVTDANGNKVTSNAATLSVTAITAHPTNVTSAAGKNVTFSVTATGSGLTYQWQYKTPTGTKWNTSTTTGAKTAKLTVQATAARNGQQYRCVVKDAKGNSITSNAATLTVNSLAIKTQPKNVTTDVGKTVTFNVSATGSGLTYQWQYKTPTGTKWNTSTSTGAKTASLKIQATAARNGQQYRCIVMDVDGKTVISDTAMLLLNKLAIIKQPESVTTTAGKTATFAVMASGEDLIYQWQYKTATGTKWNTSTAAGAKTAELSIPATSARNGQQYRCVIIDVNANTMISNAVKLTVK